MKAMPFAVGKRTRTATAILAVTIATLFAIDCAQAAPAAVIRMSTNKPEVGRTVVFDGSRSLCDNPAGCSYTWQWYWRSENGATYVGGQMGRARSIRYTFPSYAASKRYVIVALTVAAGRTVRSSTAWVSLKVEEPESDAE